MSDHARAGRPAEPADLVDVDALLRAYYELRPDPSIPAQRVAFGTSGHRGSAFKAAFNEAHILATTEAICRYRAAAGLRRSAVHRPRHARAVRAGLADGARGAGGERGRRPGRRPRRVHADPGRVARDPRRKPGDVRAGGLADGIVVTPSHNPPEDGGFKYNPPNGGPADTDVTRWIQDEANRILEAQAETASTASRACRSNGRAPTPAPYDFRDAYVADLGNVVDMAAIAASGLRIGVDPLGGAGRGLLGGDRRAVRPRPDRHQRRRSTRRSAS